MSSLQDTPQQALAGWLHQRGGESAIKKMDEDFGFMEGVINLSLDAQFPITDVIDSSTSRVMALAIALYTDGEVIFPNCPDWAVEKVKGLPHG